MTLALTTTNVAPEMQERILKSLNLNPADPKTQALLLICDRYSLDPLMKHIVLISGNPYVTRDGYLHLAHRSGVFDGIEVVEQGADNTHWTAKVAVYRKDMGRPFTYTGRYPKNGHMKQYGPEMAVKVAEVQALRRAFNVTGVPAADERWDDEALNNTVVAEVDVVDDDGYTTRKIRVPKDRPIAPPPAAIEAPAPAGPAPAGEPEQAEDPAPPPAQNRRAEVVAPELPPLPDELEATAREVPADTSARKEAGRGSTASPENSLSKSAGEGEGTAATTAGSPPPADEWDRTALKNRLRSLPSDLAQRAVMVRDQKGFPKVDEMLDAQVGDFIAKVLLPIEKEAKGRARSVALACKNAGLEGDEDRHALIRFATDGVAESAKVLTEDQAAHVTSAARDVKDGALVMVVTAEGTTFVPGGSEEVK